MNTRALFLSTASLCLFAGIPHQAWAQQAPADAEVANAETASDQQLIVVTGSRIPRAGFDTLEPATVVSSEYLETRGLTNVADALNEIPGFGVGVTPEGGQSGFGVGQNFVNRFGLGTARTLTLVNGRRFVSSNAPTIFGPAAPGLQVDLNVIPTELIERVENLAIGGAPTYGSDAIAGTVNVILKKDYQGLLVSGTAGITERGDAFRYNVSAIGGLNLNDRGNVTLALSYDDVDGVLAVDRPRNAANLVSRPNPTAGSAISNFPVGRNPGNDGRVNPNIPFNTGNTDGIPNAVFIRDDRFNTFTAGGLLLAPTGAATLARGGPRGFGAGNTTLLQFNNAGDIVPFNPGIPFGASNASGGDGFNLTESGQITSDLERFTANIIGSYELLDGLTVFAESTYYRAEALELIDQPIFNVNLFGGLSAPLIFSATDPRLSTQARATLAANGVTDFRLSRASRDLVTNNASSVQEIVRSVVGLEGDFELFGKPFSWETSANLGRSEGRFTANVLNQQNFVNAINVTTNAAGQIVCDPNPVRNVAPGGIRPIADPACVPLDVFGENRASEAARAYVTGQTSTIATLRQEVYNVNVTGAPLSLWAGDVGIALGYEHRFESGSFQPDAFQRAGQGRAVPIIANQGSFNTDEVFGELFVPLVSPDNNIPFINRLELEGKIRYVDNVVNGGFTTWTAGGRYRPINDIEFRGNFTRSLRAPAVTELFTPVSNIFTFVADPCDTRNVAGGAAPEVRARNCAAFYEFFGLNPASFQSIANDATVPGQTGGDPNLDNEVADAYTFGVVLRPSFLPRFRAAIDWNRIRITGNIANLNAADLATGCFDNEDFDTSDIPNANTFCSRIRREAPGTPNAGQIVNDPANPGVRTGFVNGDFILFQGLTAELAFGFDLPDNYGTIDINASYFYLDTLRSSNNGVVVNPDEGEIGNSQHTAQANFGYTYNDFSWDLQANYTSGAKFNNLNTVETQDILQVDTHWLFNTSFGYRFKEDTILRFTVTNLFDRQPPFPIGGVGTYDTLLRRYVLSFDYRF